MDDRLRQLERQAAAGDQQAQARLARERLRAGQSQLLGGESGNLQHVPHSDHPDNQAYRAGYKAGWAHAHRNPGAPAQPDQTRGPQYIQGYMHGHELGGHAGQFKRHFDAARYRADTPQGQASLQAANQIADEHLIKPHLQDIKRAHQDNIVDKAQKMGYVSQSGIDKTHAAAAGQVDDWASSDETGHIVLDGIRPTRRVSALQRHISNVEDGFTHPADFARNLRNSLGRATIYTG